MYQRFFRLQREPFSMSPNPAFLYLTDAHREALAGLSYGILGRKGFMVLVGEAGTGKTTLLRRVTQSIPSDSAMCSVVSNPPESPDEFLEASLRGFGITDIPAARSQRILKLEYLLLGAHHNKRICVLVVDEAQRLSLETIEEIRLLTNLETDEGKLVQVVLAGQTELRSTLNRPELRQAKQRVALQVSLSHLTMSDLDAYARFRWKTAGALAPFPFTSDAMVLIHLWSQGIPRLVNSICDNALVLAFAEGTRLITASHVETVATDLDLAPGYLKTEDEEEPVRPEHGSDLQALPNPSEAQEPAGMV